VPKGKGVKQMYKLGILGAAGIAPQAVIEPVRRREDIEVYAVAARREGAARAYAEKHLIPHAYDGYEALLSDPAVEIVYNALPPSDHAKWSIAALEAGKHVLCEKPFAMNAREAAEMAAAAERTGLHLMEAFHDRYHPAFLYVLDLKQSGRLGRIKALRAEFMAEIPNDPKSLRHVPELGGGALMDLGCYPVHWIRSLMGEEPEVLAASAIRNPLGVDENLQATLRFPSGVFVDFATSMAKGTPFSALLSIEGENGKVELENPVLAHKGHSIREWIDGGFCVHTVAGGSTFDYQLAALIQAIESGTPALTGGQDAVNNMAVIDALYEKAGFSPR
jgi:predicted dehydrogenase